MPCLVIFWISIVALTSDASIPWGRDKIVKDAHGHPELHVKAADTGYIIKFLAGVLPEHVPGAGARAAFGHRLPKGVVGILAGLGP